MNRTTVQNQFTLVEHNPAFGKHKFAIFTAILDRKDSIVPDLWLAICR